MTALKSTAKPVAELTKAWENPLIPNKRLRQLYTAMVELRLLEEHIAKVQRRTKSAERLSLHHGEEGCLAGTVLSLKPGDTTSEAHAGDAIAFMRQTGLTQLLDGLARGRKRPLGELPAVAPASSRMYLAIGAAISATAKKKGPLCVAYVNAGDLSTSEWQPILRLAAAEAAPVIFVVMPSAGSVVKSGRLSLDATKCGVPGIPVDAADPVALYRVAQESMLRARAGGGPVLMECIPFQIAGAKAEKADPIETMRQFMLPRGVADEAWFNSVSARFIARLKAATP